MTRPSPLEVALGPLVEELPAVQDAATRAGRDLKRREQFGRSPEVQRLLERLQAPDLVARQPEAADGYLSLLYATYRFWDAGAHLVAPTRERLEPVLPAAASARPPHVPRGACYLQLPAQWIWARSGDEGPHEPLDGCFLAVDLGAAATGDRLAATDDRPENTDSPVDEITVVAILGLRAGRDGFTQIALHVPPEDFVAAGAARREPPFGPLMDGGDVAGFRSVATAGELLLLVSLALAASPQ